MVRRSERGFVLLVALFVITMTMAAGAMIAGSLNFRMWQLRQEARNLHLTALTDAALARALAELSKNASYRGTGGPVPFGDGTIDIAATRPGSSQAVVVEVTATYGGGGRSVRADVRLFPLEVTRWQPIAFNP